MCGNDKPPPKAKPDSEIHHVGDSENAARNGDQQGYVQNGGLEGDDKRSAVADAMKYVREYNSPLADLGIFATRQIDGTGAGKLKSSLSNANPFYATMAASAEAQAKTPRVAGATQPTGTQSLKIPGAGSGVTRNYRIGG